MEKELAKVVIHYHRKNADYDNWSLWLWEIPQRMGKQYEFNGKDDYGLTATLPLSNWSKLVTFNNLGMIIKATDSWHKDGSDKIIKFYKMDPNKDNEYHIYVKQDDDELYLSEHFERINSFIFAKFLDWKTAAIKTFDPFTEISIFKDNKLLVNKVLEKPEFYFVNEFENDISLDSNYRAEIKLKNNGKIAKRRIRFSELYKTEKFVKNYDATSEELGAICDKNSTTFKVWSPVSRKVILRLYKCGTPTEIDPKKGNDNIYLEQEMEKLENGVFFAKIPGNFHGFYYNYVVTNDVYKEREIVDIYAKSAGVNGIRGMVVDFSQIDGENLREIEAHPYDAKTLTVYETHIADLTSSKSWSNNPKSRKLSRTFLGAALEGTIYEDNGRVVKTGFDHIKELGVNAVQLLPIFDQTNEERDMLFNWGYNPLNYNCLEGGYSTNPYDGLVRIKEFKQLVKKYHDAGINIIMDVVYNHVYAAAGSNFDVLMPGYYFRYTRHGNLSNASGCGNETASEMPMFRKFMLDSIMFWAKEYKLGGFRFDLMALHDIETMNLIAKSLHDYNKHIVIYGEPWAADRSMLPIEKTASKDNANQFEGYGFFSDTTRDALVRTTKDINCAGWCANYLSSSEDDKKRIIEGIKGTTGNVLDPNKVLNYVSCHDNRTLFDRLKFDAITDKKLIKRVAMLANSIVLTSNGISFILAGEEFLRSKKGSDNSYNASYEINELDYSLKLENLDMFKNYQKLIWFKQNVSELALEKNINHLLKVDDSLPNAISYELGDAKTGRKYLVIHVNGYRVGKPIIVDLRGYKLYLDTINPYKELSNSTALIPYETLIVYK